MVRYSTVHSNIVGTNIVEVVGAYTNGTSSDGLPPFFFPLADVHIALIQELQNALLLNAYLHEHSQTGVTLVVLAREDGTH